MPLPLSDYASPIEPTWLAIIFPVPLYPLSLWERARVRGAGCHNAGFVKSGRGNKRSEWHRSCISAKEVQCASLITPRITVR